MASTLALMRRVPLHRYLIAQSVSSISFAQLRWHSSSMNESVHFKSSKPHLNSNMNSNLSSNLSSNSSSMNPNLSSNLNSNKFDSKSMTHKSTKLSAMNKPHTRHSSIAVNAHEISIEFESDMDSDHVSETASFSLQWLRDNCPCPRCLHPITNQRTIDTLTIPWDIGVDHVELIGPNHSNDKSSSNSDDTRDMLNGLLAIRWKPMTPSDELSPIASLSHASPYSASLESHLSEYPIEWLHSIYRQSKHQHQRKIQSPSSSQSSPVVRLSSKQTLWNRSLKIPRISLKEFQTREGMREWLRSIDDFGVAIITGVAADAAGAQQVTRLVGEPMETIFGLFWDIQQQPNAALWEHFDTAYTNVALRAHTDGNYMTEAPRLQFFQIPHHGGDGGDTLLVDGFKVARDIKHHTPALYYFLAKHPVGFHYLEDSIALQADQFVFRHINRHQTQHKTLLQENSMLEAKPIDQQHEIGGELGELVQFSYNNDDRTPMYFDPKHASIHYQAISELMRTIRDPENELWIKLKPDELLCTDNWRVMHGRSSFTGPRRLMGCYISHSDFSNRLREFGGETL